MAATLGLGAAGVATLAACGSSSNNKGKSIGGVASGLIASYDRSGDSQVDLKRESTRSDTVYDEDGDGYYGDEIVDRWSIAALVSHADGRGDRDGRASERELTAVIRRFDVGGEKSIAGDGILGDAEADRFDRSFPEVASMRRAFPDGAGDAGGTD